MVEPIMWGGDDPFTHLLCVGPTRCGKSATILKPMMYQLLKQKKKGKKVGFSLVEPKGDLVRDIKEFCDVMEIPYVYIDPESPDSHRFNVMEGDKDDVAEATVAVLQSLFGKQEAFFQTVQELSTRNVTKLLKELKGDDLDLLDLLETLRDERLLERRVKELRAINPNSDLLNFFENELLGSLQDHYRKLVVGLRAQLENITSNDKLRRIISGKSDINLDKHFEEGGVLLVNTSLGTLRKAGDAFGQFVIMHLQSATFRREGTERTRVPHFLIADEYSRYINPDVEMFLSIAASYRVAGVFATQSLGQLEVEAGKISAKAMKQAILTSCRNKIAFCGLSAQDAKEFAEEFGKDKVIMRQSTYKNRILLPRFFPDNYRDTEIEEYRYHYTYLQDSMKRFHFLCRIMKDGTPQRPFEGIGQFVPRNWKELREWEDKSHKSKAIFNLIPNGKELQKKVVNLFSFKKYKKENTKSKLKTGTDDTLVRSKIITQHTFNQPEETPIHKPEKETKLVFNIEDVPEANQINKDEIFLDLTPIGNNEVEDHLSQSKLQPQPSPISERNITTKEVSNIDYSGEAEVPADVPIESNIETHSKTTENIQHEQYKHKTEFENYGPEIEQPQSKAEDEILDKYENEHYTDNVKLKKQSSEEKTKNIGFNDDGFF
jgi:TraM recognition site of TraD and TraG